MQITPYEFSKTVSITFPADIAFKQRRNITVKWCQGCACCSGWANLVYSTPTAFSCPLFQAGYDPRGFFRRLLHQLPLKPPTVDRPTRDRGHLSQKPMWDHVETRWTNLWRSPSKDKSHSIQALFDFAVRFSFQKPNSNHRPNFLNRQWNHKSNHKH